VDTVRKIERNKNATTVLLKLKKAGGAQHRAALKVFIIAAVILILFIR
jgi:hypothetical protein